MTYNLTAINASNSTIGFFQGVNTMSHGVLGNGWSIVLFVVLFSYFLYHTKELNKSLIGAGMISFVVSGIFFLSLDLVIWYLVLVYLMVFILGIILSLDRDYST